MNWSKSPSFINVMQPIKDFPVSVRKEGPKDLMYQVNESHVPSGGSIMIMSKKDKGDIKKITNNLYITNLNMSYQEKAQLLETFGASSVSFFGDSIKVYQISGQALDYPSGGDDPHRTMHMGALNLLYNNHLRATKLIQDGNIGVVKIFNHLIYGYALSLKTSYSSSTDKLGSFSFSWLVVKHTQNLPGLFSEKDLEDLSNTTSLAQTEEGQKNMDYINAMLEKISTNLIIKLNSFGAVGGEESGGRNVPVSLDLLDFISSTNSESIGSFKDNLAIRTSLARNDSEEKPFGKLLVEIRESIINFIGSIAGEEETNDSPSILNLSNSTLANHVGPMFTEKESFGEVISFLRGVNTLRGSLITRKVQLMYSSK